MTKIARFNGDLPAFASESEGNERTVFDGFTQSDALTDQFTQGFLRGWAVVAPAEFPTREDFNAAFFTATKLISYLHQMGVPEWNIQQRYYEGSLTTTGGLIYRSRTGTSETPNVGNEPSASGAEWALILDATQYATQAQAQSGTSLTGVMNPQRTTDHFNARTTTLTRTILGRDNANAIRGDLQLTALATAVSSTYSRGLLELGTASAWRGQLELGTMATRNVGTAGTEHRTNSQNDGRFARLAASNVFNNPKNVFSNGSSYSEWTGQRTISGVSHESVIGAGSASMALIYRVDGVTVGRLDVRDGEVIAYDNLRVDKQLNLIGPMRGVSTENSQLDGNLGVGASPSGSLSEGPGIQLGAVGFIQAIRDANPVLTMKRLNSNGPVFRVQDFDNTNYTFVVDSDGSFSSSGNASIGQNLTVGGTINGSAIVTPAGGRGSTESLQYIAGVGTLNYGDTTAGSNLRTAAGVAPTGTWRCKSYENSGGDTRVLFERI